MQQNLTQCIVYTVKVKISLAEHFATLPRAPWKLKCQIPKALFNHNVCQNKIKTIRLKRKY